MYNTYQHILSAYAVCSVHHTLEMMAYESPIPATPVEIFFCLQYCSLCVSYMLNVVVKIYPFVNNHGVADMLFRTFYYELNLVRGLHPLKMSSALEGSAVDTHRPPGEGIEKICLTFDFLLNIFFFDGLKL